MEAIDKRLLDSWLKAMEEQETDHVGKLRVHELRRAVMHMPTVQAENIVRCEECVYARHPNPYSHRIEERCLRADVLICDYEKGGIFGSLEIHGARGFCGYGKRREEKK